MRFNYILNWFGIIVARIGMVAVLGGLILALGILLYLYTENQTNLVQTTSGETVKVGSVNYVITLMVHMRAARK